jgi:hypothetical protein
MVDKKFRRPLHGEQSFHSFIDAVEDFRGPGYA